MPPREGLPGLDFSLSFSAERVDHLFLVLPGAGDAYVDHAPWMTSLETSLTSLSSKFERVSVATFRQGLSASDSAPPPSALFLPIEWHRAAFETWQAEIRHADPRPGLQAARRNGVTTVREAVAETVGDVLLMSSPVWRAAIAQFVGKQIRAQVEAVRRNRPKWNGRLSLLVHSVAAMIAVECLGGGFIKGEDGVRLDAVVFAGCPIPAYVVLSPDESRQMCLEVLRRERERVRFINVFHPLDPVAYRLEPFVEVEKGAGGRQPVKVKALRRGFWEDAGGFWEEAVESLWNTLFAGGERGEGGGVGEFWGVFGGRRRGGDGNGEEVAARGIKKWKSYVLEDGEGDEDGEVKSGGSEVLLSDRIDYELQDGMGVPALDVMASWGAIKAHTYYWQSLDVVQILLDIAVTSDESMGKRG